MPGLSSGTGPRLSVSESVRLSDIAHCLREAGLYPTERRVGLSDLRQDIPHQGAALAHLRELVEAIGLAIAARPAAPLYPAWWTVLQSQEWGTGKSALAKAAVVEVCRLRKRAQFTTLIGLMDELRAAQDPESEFGLAQVKRKYARAVLLVLDDFGKERITDFVPEQVFDLIDTRVRTGRPTIITTNLTDAEITRRYGAQYGPAALSRMIGGCWESGDFAWLAMEGPDLRDRGRA